MRLDPFNAVHAETLLAVVLGAVLATLSGLAASQFESHMRRREREHDAALLFGELLSTLKILIANADETRGRGDPYGGITMRMLRAVRRELDIYDRNREALYDLRQAPLRLRIHSLMVRFALALDGVFDSHDALMGSTAPESDPRHEPLREGRARSFGFLVENATEIESMLAALAKPARRVFDLDFG